MAVQSACVMALLASAVLNSARAQVAVNTEERPTPEREEAEWSLSRWGHCSMSCGGGVQRRVASCYFTTGDMAPASACHNPRPAEVKSCPPKDCPPEVYYVPGQCSQSCGGGYRVPNRKCRHVNALGHMEELPLSNCSHLRRNVSIMESCTNPPPCKPFYSIGKWSPCSATCGTGRQSRRVRCIQFQEQRNVRVAHQHCRRLLGRMKSTQLCRTPYFCPNDYKWSPGKWSLCKVNCEKHRHVRCFSVKDNTYADEKFCNQQKKPVAVKKCINSGTYTWQANRWRACSVTCGEGIQTREVYCANPLKGQWARSCPLCMKPPDMRPCNTHRSCNADHVGESFCAGDTHFYCGLLRMFQRKKRLLHCKSRTLEELCPTTCNKRCNSLNDERVDRRE